MSDRILISHRHRLKGYPHFGLYLQTKVVRARSNLRLAFSTFIIYHTWAHVKTVEQILWEDYSTPNSEPFLPFSLIHNRTDDFGASFCPSQMQSIATIPANVCNRPRKRLREKMPLFRLYTLYIYNKGAIREPYLHRICVIWPCKHGAA